MRCVNCEHNIITVTFYVHVGVVCKIRRRQQKKGLKSIIKEGKKKAREFETSSKGTNKDIITYKFVNLEHHLI